VEADEFRRLKGVKKVTMLSAYDYQMAMILDKAGIDIILVGDSLGVIVFGYEGTKQVTMADMARHVGAVAIGVKVAHVVGDMPIASYDNVDDALRNAQTLLDAGADSVKLEGLNEPVIEALTSSGIPVMGHLGLQPQTAEKIKMKGKKADEAERIYAEAQTLDNLGVYSMVLEYVPSKLAEKVTGGVKAIILGIGAGNQCDGQVLIINDMLGMKEGPKFKHVKLYTNLNQVIFDAVTRYIEDVRTGRFPAEEHALG
jgi:3-methyl-2-oxobutanoate hydroxymethyltransferase